MNGASLGGEKPPQDDVDEPAQKGCSAFAYRDFRLSLFSKLVSSVAIHMVMIAGAFWKLFPELAHVQRMDRSL